MRERQYFTECNFNVTRNINISENATVTLFEVDIVIALVSSKGASRSPDSSYPRHIYTARSLFIWLAAGEM